MFPKSRMRRLRRNNNIRKLIRETHLSVNDLIMPIFIDENLSEPEPIKSMPGQFRIPIDNLRKELTEIISLNIPGVLFFGIPSEKDEIGTSASDKNGVVQTAVKKTKEKFKNKILIITDLCLCQYTNHGHCGIIKNGELLNDPTLERMGEIAVSHARAGTDIVAPSSMIDGQVDTIRRALDSSDFQNVSIMSYSAKFASNFYGPFRDAADSAPSFGDRKSYQMDYSNSEEAIREVALDIKEGADMIMIKPALAYLDLVRRVKNEFKFPTAVYNVSGEYSMIKAAAEKGWINEKAIVIESLTAMKRAGADLILTYFAKDVAKWLSEK